MCRCLLSGVVPGKFTKGLLWSHFDTGQEAFALNNYLGTSLEGDTGYFSFNNLYRFISNSLGLFGLGFNLYMYTNVDYIINGVMPDRLQPYMAFTHITWRNCFSQAMFCESGTPVAKMLVAIRRETPFLPPPPVSS